MNFIMGMNVQYNYDWHDFFQLPPSIPGGIKSLDIAVIHITNCLCMEYIKPINNCQQILWLVGFYCVL